MTLQSFSWTDSVSKFRQGWPLFRLTKRAADAACLERGPGATTTIAGSMSKQGLQLLRERQQRMAAATFHEEKLEIWQDIRLRATQIDYRLEDPNYDPSVTP